MICSIIIFFYEVSFSHKILQLSLHVSETNILLGSIERMELQRLISNTLTRENKLKYFRNRQKERLQQRMAGMPSSPASQRQEPPAEGSLQVKSQTLQTLLAHTSKQWQVSPTWDLMAGDFFQGGLMNMSFTRITHKL